MTDTNAEVAAMRAEEAELTEEIEKRTADEVRTRFFDRFDEENHRRLRAAHAQLARVRARRAEAEGRQ